MKPMIALLLFGIITTGGVFMLGLHLHDGVVEDRTYTAALNYDKNRLLAEEIKKSIIFNDIKKVGDKFILDAVITSKETPVVVLYPTKREDRTIFTFDNGTYSTDKKLKTGWYNLEFTYLIDNRTVPVRYSYYLN